MTKLIAYFEYNSASKLNWLLEFRVVNGYFVWMVELRHRNGRSLDVEMEDLHSLVAARCGG